MLKLNKYWSKQTELFALRQQLKNDSPLFIFPSISFTAIVSNLLVTLMELKFPLMLLGGQETRCQWKHGPQVA